ncbi:hypothetical protein, partial [Endozoicomonas montiporae]|uniref:hypothetical protein n=1 Tax=Endozoicomonas montiporae TaxID=1027273 RepID=UPI001F1C6369
GTQRLHSARKSRPAWCAGACQPACPRGRGSSRNFRAICRVSCKGWVKKSPQFSGNYGENLKPFLTVPMRAI